MSSTARSPAAINPPTRRRGRPRQPGSSAPVSRGNASVRAAPSADWGEPSASSFGEVRLQRALWACGSQACPVGARRQTHQGQTGRLSAALAIGRAGDPVRWDGRRRAPRRRRRRGGSGPDGEDPGRSGQRPRDRPSQ